MEFGRNVRLMGFGTRLGSFWCGARVVERLAPGVLLHGCRFVLVAENGGKRGVTVCGLLFW